MQLSPSDKLGHFQIVGLLGRGGMGEVYRGRDTELKREVALKVLPGVFARDPERMARFQREAEVLASLNHPNIAAIYGVESDGDNKALVMELVEGEAPKGPLPFEEAWAIASQIASALEYAHDKNVIHRDLKPANVKVTPDGVVKLLDFGLAKALSNRREASAPIGEDSPTLTMGATEAGVILGTASYMAPEQAKGKPVDKRADVWSFGVVLYELLTGQRLFKGEDVADTLAQVLTKEVDVSAVAPRARKLLRRCLEREPKNRLRDIGEARHLVEEVTSAPEGASAPPPPSMMGWIAAAVLAAMGIAAVWTLWPQPKPLLPMTRLEVDLGENVTLGAPAGPDAVISPDGTKLAYISNLRMFLLRLDQPQAAPLKLTDLPGPNSLAFSPDGGWIAFAALSGVRKVALTGGAAQALAQVSGFRGTDWGADGGIVFATVAGPLMKIPEAGGEPQPITKKNPGEAAHRWPQVLNGGLAVLFSVQLPGGPDAGLIDVVTLKDGVRKTLVRGGAFGRYVEASDGTGYLTYVSQSTLFAVPFDASKLELYGTPVPVLEGVGAVNADGGARLSFSRTGTLVFRSGGGGSRVVRFMNSSGTIESILDRRDSYSYPRLSPDGQKLLIVATEGGSNDVWVYDVKGGRSARLTTGVGGTFAPIWTPDGRYVVFQGAGGMFWTRSDGGSQPQLLLPSNNIQYAWSFTPDGKRLVYMDIDPTTGYGLWTLPVETTAAGLKAGTPEKYLVTTNDERHPSFSPDGKWIAYASDESGRSEVYVRRFPDTGGKWTVSAGGGHYPVWSQNGRDLFYRTEDGQVMVTRYSIAGDAFASDPPRKFADRKLAPLAANGTYDVATDGRIVGLFPAEDEAANRSQSHVTFLINFADEIRRRVGTGK